jgi:hypothetical protein
MALTIRRTQDIIVKVERLAEKRGDLFQLNLTLNILGSYTARDVKDGIFAKRDALQKEIELIESELAFSK